MTFQITVLYVRCKCGEYVPVMWGDEEDIGFKESTTPACDDVTQ